jgi:putative transposase
VDEAGFAPTLPTRQSWSEVGQRRRIPYEAPQGRRVNTLGAYFSHGPQTGHFEFYSLVTLPTRRQKHPPAVAVQAVAHGLTAEEVGKIDSEVFLAFLWTVAGRPSEAGEDWRRERPVHFVVDNYSVHKSERVQQEQAALAAAGIHLFYLPSYSPELSRMEPHWQNLKGAGMPERTYPTAGALKRAVDLACLRTAKELRQSYAEPAVSLPRTP